MKCILVRLHGYAVLNFSDEAYYIASSIFTRTEIIDMVGKMLCTSVGPKENLLEVFDEFVMSRIGYVVDHRNAHLPDPQTHEAIWTDTEKDLTLEYFVRCYKGCLPYIPDAGELKFMACVWHEDANQANDSVCLVAEFTHTEEDLDECTSQIELRDTVREAIARDRDDSRPLFAVFT